MRFPVWFLSMRVGRTAAIAAVAAGLAMLGGCSTVSVEISPVLAVTPTALSFGLLAVGSTSTAQSVTLTNEGPNALTISGVAASGDFGIASNGCGSGLAVGASCQVGVVFTPTAVGSRSGTLTVTSNAQNGAQTVALSGTGGLAAATLTPASLSFGAVNVGSVSGALTVMITSTGTAPLTISGIAVSGDFQQASSSCTALLAINQTCQVSIVFRPTTTGTRTGALTLTSNGTGSPQTVALSGTGTAPVSFAGLPITVTVKGGTGSGAKTIAGASVQLYAAGTTGNGSAATALLSAALTTSALGVVTIPAYTCPTATTLLYVVATGGTVGSAASANGNVKLMGAIGPCNGVSSGAKYTVNEATTVAAGYALAPFYVSGSVGASGTNLTGITNAFLTANTLADPGSGAIPGAALPANAASPATRMNAVANILNACVATAANCAAFFSATYSGSTPTNTLDAMFNLAHNPAANVATLYGQSLLSASYAPALTQAPTDWTMFVTLSGGGMNSPAGIGVDSTGSVWVASYFYAASKFAPTGAAVFANGITGSGLNNSYGLAIDGNDDVWIPNEQPFTSAGIGTVTELSSSGTALSGAGGYINGGLDYPLSVAIDTNGTVWVLDFGDSYLTLLNSLGTPLSGANGYTTPLFAFPVAVAVDGNHYGWIANQDGANVTKVAPDGSSFVNFACCNAASGIAIDQSNNVWAANYYGNSVSLISSTGTIVSNGTYTGAGSLNRPQGIAVDGAGNIWVANYRAGYLTELAGAGLTSTIAPGAGASISPAGGLGADAKLLEAYALSVDASGNIWVSNQGSNTVTKMIGLATPVKTPLLGLPKAP